jgi:hypothetical protein
MISWYKKTEPGQTLSINSHDMLQNAFRLLLFGQKYTNHVELAQINLSTNN